MAIVEQVKCDICGKQKADVNHWWLFGVMNVLGTEDVYTSFEAKPWIESEAEWMRHACGQECLTQAVNRWMGEQSK